MITNRALKRSAAALIEMRPKTKYVKKHEIRTKENIPVVRTGVNRYTPRYGWLYIYI